MTLKLRISILILACLSFYGCAPKTTIVKPPEFTGDITAEGVKPTESAEDYLELAKHSTGQVRNGHLIKAAQIFVQAGEVEKAKEALLQVDSKATRPEQNTEIELLYAKIEIDMGQPNEAYMRLGPLKHYSSIQQIRLMHLRARALLDAGYPLESARVRVELDTLLMDENDRFINQQSIWDALSLLPLTSLQQAGDVVKSRDFLGWIELAQAVKQAQVDWKNLQQVIARWHKGHLKHPAASHFIQELGYKQTELLTQPEHIAVLLPLSGRYAAVSAALRDGIMASYYQHPNSTFKPQISFIDTAASQQDIWAYYQQASDMGADFVIGPFLKSEVELLARSSHVQVPTLTLNYATEQNEATRNLFQLGLLPEDEAQQSAEMAFRQGHTHAAILVPEGDWGERLRLAFQQRFEELGGKVISVQNYKPNSNDYKQPIQSMLNISQSYSRYHSIQNRMSLPMKFTPYRRQDVDMIFIGATPRDARQLKPQFRFHYAGEIPVYSTSHVYSGVENSQADRDIDELNFCDMPWILNPQGELKQVHNRYWPQQNYTRFFAMGVDAYNLIPYLTRLQEKPYERFSGQTGNLYLDSFNRIHRELLWAQFDKGVPRLIDINDMHLSVSHDKTRAVQPARN